MSKKKKKSQSNQINKSQKQVAESWLGNPDDHEPTRKVAPEDVNV